MSLKCGGFTATWRDKHGQSRTFDKAKAEALAARLNGKEARVTELKRTWKQTVPPAAYDLTELQRDANKKYAYSAKETLSMMQLLYPLQRTISVGLNVNF